MQQNLTGGGLAAPRPIPEPRPTPDRSIQPMEFSIRRVVERFGTYLPRGGSLPDEVWRQRHRFLVGLTWFHALIIALLGPALGYDWEFSFRAPFRDGTVWHTFGEALAVATCAVLAGCARRRALKASLVGVGLMTSSAVLVHLSGGLIELHFHFFVMIIFMALYESWIAFAVAVFYVAIHHGVVGVLWPEAVYNHARAIAAPWTWAGIHAFFVLCASVGSIIAWRYNEKTYASAARAANDARRVLERIQTLHGINSAVTSTLDLQSVLQVLMEKLDTFLPSTAVLVWLVNRESGTVERATCHNLDEADWKERKLDGTPRLVRLAIESRRPVIVRNIQTDSRAADPAFYRRNGLISYLGIPLVVRDEALGVLVFLTREEHEFAADEIEFFSSIAGHAAIAIHNSQLYEQTRNQARELEQANRELKRREEIQTLFKQLNEDVMRLGIDSLFKKLTEKVREILRVDISDVRVLVDGRWKLIGISGIDPRLLTANRSGTGRGPGGWIQTHRQPLVIPDLNSTTIPMGGTMRRLGLRSFVGVPLFSRAGDVIGVLRGMSYTPRAFSQEEVELLEQLAIGGAVALENARLFEQIQEQAVALEEANRSKDALLRTLEGQKADLSRLNVGLEREIAERTKAEAEIAAKNRDLETLLYVTSHDLREPLRAIENFSRIVNDRYADRLDDRGRDFLRRVIQGAQRLNRLLDDILMLSRSQRIGAPSEKVDGAEIISEALKRLEGKIASTNARIRVMDGFGGLRVDKTWATQAVYNLIANALKFTTNGAPPDIELAPYYFEQSRSVAGIVVRDRGPGVAPEHAERIFQLFQRAVGREIEGTGAGLAIVRQIAQRHGGHAWVQPRAGGGSEFVITFGGDKNVEGEKER
ncbi:MAG TPA: GAF domain-containing protein [Candidatus Eisenbacteria bacterium]|nr:GAF domain-containing protein [Candidatus Eisenbacteria bacterium]